MSSPRPRGLGSLRAHRGDVVPRAVVLLEGRQRVGADRRLHLAASRIRGEISKKPIHKFLVVSMDFSIRHTWLLCSFSFCLRIQSESREKARASCNIEICIVETSQWVDKNAAARPGAPPRPQRHEVPAQRQDLDRTDRLKTDDSGGASSIVEEEK